MLIRLMLHCCQTGIGPSLLTKQGAAGGAQIALSHYWYSAGKENVRVPGDQL